MRYFLLLLISLPLWAQPRFEAQTLDSSIRIGYGLAIGDVDGDQRPDVLLADQKQIFWYRNRDWRRFVMAENLTEHDNVCLAAKDLNGDGRVEVAVGAQWNPGETSDATQSGSVHYLVRPADPTQPWQAVALPHEPTVHRMRWVPTSQQQWDLVVVPLHGRGNQNGEGAGVKVLAYRFPEAALSAAPARRWDTLTVNQEMHMTHNLAVDLTRRPRLLLAGKEGVLELTYHRGTWQSKPLAGMTQGAGEVRLGKGKTPFVATIEPMHGNALVVYREGKRQVLTDRLNQGHALACADLLALGYDQIVVGWRNPDADGKVGIQLFVPTDASGTAWTAHWVDENGMACEDLNVADLDGDGRLDIIAAGRDSHNLKVYWNRKPE
ncbi:Repeat domain-containing protein [Catalinimonas alkaloidigena]|uniref:Repeat domain-containing protein n=1 Tax=Catalinimonas alkaloidigena TaxID=1075417 RepID=A0A1G9N8G0_9BACT|nr:VCBS repeat-containing protein [Catalinimonas alkaloidigena]SDL82720.1 Repeat domain-containing protein [Catalinimonas alkaloidigena]